ncbi:unnamed protein product [Fraxinus pennsylvanica]|uniref:F-box domain-containing protein n=1 Tax=Fraxinus pennsylvanica TaxID=56036 RepID=A0AAD2E1F8_9LAMI|nr:unnamed protein product [Fraxinus pennsylvanica]
METLSINNVDRISQLPDSLCHHVLSFLSAADAGMTVFLSRRWRFLWYSSPVYNFDEKYFVNTISYSSPANFLMFLERTLAHRQWYFNHLGIEKFRIYMRMFYELNPLALNWVVFALNCNVKELVIINEGIDCPTIPSTLSDAIFVAKYITKLEISHLYLEEISVSVNLPSLQELVLRGTLISDSTLQKIIFGCSIVRKICLELLHGGEKIMISKETLVELNVFRCLHVEFYIEYAPNLKLFAYEGGRIERNKIGISALGNLRSLSLIEARVMDSVLEDLVLEYPLLEELVIGYCSTVKKLLISSPKLESFVLFGCELLVEVKIDAPNLLKLEYRGELVNFSSVISSPLLEVSIHLERNNHSSSTDWYPKLKDLCEKLQYSKALLLACHEDLDLIVPKKMRKRLLPQLHALRHLKVKITISLERNGWKLEEGLRWIFPCLRTLDIVSCFNCFENHYEYKEDMLQLLGGTAGLSLEEHTVP